MVFFIFPDKIFESPPVIITFKSVNWELYWDIKPSISDLIPITIPISREDFVSLAIKLSGYLGVISFNLNAPSEIDLILIFIPGDIPPAL